MVTDHPLSKLVLGAFAEGLPDATLAPVGTRTDAVPVFYGILRGCGEEIKHLMTWDKPFLYIDHGYFDRSRHADGDYSGHYRIVRGGLFPIIPTDPAERRASSECFSRLGIEIAEWRNLSDRLPTLVSPPTKAVAEFHGVDVAEWIEYCRVLYGKIEITTKKAGDFRAKALKCRLFVSHSSQAALEALLLGVPARCTAPRAPIPIGGAGPGFDRVALFYWLAERQFTLGEMAHGDHLEFVEREMQGDRAASVVGAAG